MRSGTMYDVAAASSQSTLKSASALHLQVIRRSGVAAPSIVLVGQLGGDGETRRPASHRTISVHTIRPFQRDTAHGTQCDLNILV